MAKIRRRARKDRLVAEANGYSEWVNKWFKENESAFEQKREELVSLELMQLEGCDPAAEAVSVTDACDVIRWYQYQIQVKFARALSSDGERTMLGDEAMLSDALGSAKVALLGIDRSVAAWAVLRQALPDHADEILDVLVGLDRLRRAGEARFPDARAFIRPGLDG
jgi:hypothetical protein